jgi:hypothetical protein
MSPQVVLHSHVMTSQQTTTCGAQRGTAQLEVADLVVIFLAIKPTTVLPQGGGSWKPLPNLLRLLMIVVTATENDMQPSLH